MYYIITVEINYSIFIFVILTNIPTGGNYYGKLI